MLGKILCAMHKWLLKFVIRAKNNWYDLEFSNVKTSRIKSNIMDHFLSIITYQPGIERKET